MQEQVKMTEQILTMTLAKQTDMVESRRLQRTRGNVPKAAVRIVENRSDVGRIDSESGRSIGCIAYTG